MYYLFAILAVALIWFIYTSSKRERAMREATEVILDTLRKNSSAMSAIDIHYAITQAEIDVRIEDVYHQLTLLCESRLVRCYSQPVIEGVVIKTHGTFAIDSISDYSR
jgi:homoserine trans-succinylase